MRRPAAIALTGVTCLLAACGKGGAGDATDGGGVVADRAGDLAGPGSGGAGPAGGTGGAATTGGTGGSTTGTGTGGAAPDLSRCPIRSCLERLAVVRQDCTGFDAACVYEDYGSQRNYCIANGVRVYQNQDAVTPTATILKPDGHTCYSIYLTVGDTTITAAVRDAEGTTIYIEQDSTGAMPTSKYQCDSVVWTDDGTSCGAIFTYPFATCPKSTAGVCQRP